MVLTYRGNGAWGSGKGSALTEAEFDGNTYTLHLRIKALEDNPPEPNDIASISAIGSVMTVTLDDATAFSFDMPVATFVNRGTWAAATSYNANDIVKVAGAGLYLVLTDHTSESVFDADASDSTGEWYLNIFPAQENLYPEVKTVSGATYDVVFTDPGTYIRCTNGTPDTAGVACAVTLGAAANAAIDIGSEIHFRESGGGSITFTGAGGVSINSVAGYQHETRGAGSVVTLKKVGSTNWDIFGALLEVSA